MSVYNTNCFVAESGGWELICPDCGEHLTPADVEEYAHCPYCDHAFVRDARFEEFVASPMVQHWMGATFSHFPRI